MTAEQLKALDKYLMVKMFEMVARGLSGRPTPETSKVRAEAFAKVSEEFNISDEEWRGDNGSV